jgi:glycerol-3-phosphate acyltransferase PlsY
VPVIGYIATIVVAYLLGSIPTGFLVAQAKGIDIRTVGSGNIGATNVFRYLGAPAGVLVMLADAAKGWIAVALATHLVWRWSYPEGSAQAREWFGILAALAAVLGHNYTCWLSFKGGKGIATSAGVLLAIVPWSFAIILAVFVVVLWTTKYVSLASVLGAFTLPFAAWATGESGTMIAITAGMTALAIYKHKANIKRLFNGTESRIGRKPAAAPSSQQPST